MPNRFLSPLSLTLVGIMSMLPTKANAAESLKISGFGNIGIMKAGNSDYGYNIDLIKEAQFGGWSFKPNTSFGLQLNAEINDDLDFIIQGIFQNQIATDIGDRISWAFLRYQASPAITVKAGRFASPVYMLSEYRNVGFAYPWTKPISDFYTPIPVTYVEGIDINHRQRLGDGVLNTKVFYGRSNVTIQNYFTAVDVTLQPMYGIQLQYSSGDWLFSANASTTKTDKGAPEKEFTDGLDLIPSSPLLWPEKDTLRDTIQLTGKRISYYSIGSQYDSGNWILQSELSYTDANWVFTPDLIAGYLSLGKRIDNKTIFGFGSKTKTTDSAYNVPLPLIPLSADATLAALYQGLSTQIRSRQIDQHSFGVGVRWDIHPQIAIKGQVERSWINNNKTGLWSSALGGTGVQAPDHIDTISASLNFVF